MCSCIQSSLKGTASWKWKSPHEDAAWHSLQLNPPSVQCITFFLFLRCRSPQQWARLTLREPRALCIAFTTLCRFIYSLSILWHIIIIHILYIKTYIFGVVNMRIGSQRLYEFSGSCISLCISMKISTAL